MRGLIVAWAMVGIVAGAEPEVVKSRIEAIKTVVAGRIKSLTQQIETTTKDLRAIKAAGINPRLEQESDKVGGRRVFRSRDARDARAAKVEAELAGLTAEMNYLKAGGVAFPGLTKGVKVGSYGAIYAFEVIDVAGPDEARISLAWERRSFNDGSYLGTDYETCLLRGFSTKDWADGQKVTGPIRNVECLSVDRNDGTSTLVLTPIDPAPYEAALRRK